MPDVLMYAVLKTPSAEEKSRRLTTVSGTAITPEAITDSGVVAERESESVIDRASEVTLAEFIERQLLPYLRARRGGKFRLGHARQGAETFRHLRLRVAEAYRSRVEEMEGWCDERRLLDLQVRLQHWLHGWLLIHAPLSFLLLLMTGWHAFVTLFHY